MKTFAKLKPIKLDEAWRNRPWMVSVPPALSDIGKRQKLYFATKEEAEKAAQTYNAKRETFGQSLGVLTPVRIAEAANAYQLLDGSALKDKVSLIECVKAGLEVLADRSKSVSFETLVAETLSAKEHRSPFYLDRLRYVAGQFEYLNPKLVSDISPVDLEPKFKELRDRPATYNSDSCDRKPIFEKTSFSHIRIFYARYSWFGFFT